MKLKPIIQYILLSFLVLLLVILLVTSWLIATQSGLRFIVNTSLKALPELKIQQINGRLIGPLSIENLHYADANIALRLNRAEFDWQPSELRLSAVIVNQLILSGVDIKQLSQSKATTSNKPAPTLDDIIKQLQLPVTTTLKKVSLNDLHYDGDFYKEQNAPDKKPPIVIHHLHFAAKSDSQKIQLENVKFDSNLAQLDGNIKIGLAKSEKTEGRIEWEIKQRDISPITGLTQLSGNTKRLVINNNIAKPYTSEINISIDNLIKAPSAAATVVLQKINPQAINSEWPPYITDGLIEIKGDLNKATFTTALTINNKQVDNKPFDTLTTDTQGTWENDTLIFELEARAPSLVESLTVVGEIVPKQLQQASANDAINVNVNWRDYNKANTSDNSLYSPEGKIRLEGNIEQYSFDLTALLETINTQKQSGQLLIQGKGSQDALSFNQIELTGPVGTLDGKGDITIKPVLRADIALSGKNLNPGILSPQWPGQLDLDLLVISETKNNNTVIHSTIQSNGTLRQYPFALDAKGSYSKNRIDLNNLNLRSGKSTLNASANIKNQQLFANWQLTSRQLQELIPNTQGALFTKGKLAFIPLNLEPSTVIKPIATIELKGSNIAAADQQVEQLNTKVDIDWRSTDTKKSNIFDINASNIVIDNTTIHSAALQFKGRPEKHNIDSVVKSDKGNIEFSFSGKALDLQQNARWLFSLNKATVSPENLTPWQLKSTAKGSISATQQKLETQCWLTPHNPTQHSELCFDLEHNNDKLAANITLAQLYSEYLNPLLPENLSWRDTVIKGEGKITGATENLNSTIQLTTSPGQLKWAPTSTTQGKNTDTTEKIQAIDLGTGSLSIQHNNGSLNAEVHLPLEQQTGLSGKLSIASRNHTPFIESPLKGQLTLQLNELAPLVSFIPDASELQGTLNSEWVIGGSINKPWLEGNLTLNNGQIRLDTPGIFVEDIALALQGNRQQGINYTLGAQSGGGSLEAIGNIQLKEQGPAIKLTIKGKDFQALNTSDAIVYASPDLNIYSSENSIDINGTIAVPKASITPKKIPDSVVTVSEDEMIVDENGQGSQSVTQQQVSTNIDLVLGNDVHIDGFGFKGKTSGTLKISKEKQGPTLGNGDIRIIDGEYRAFGQGLVIEKGIVIFSNGPINKPGIDIKALRRPAEGITVGVFARGNIAQPTLTIFSEPGMTQTEQLSWLILGRPPEQSSEGENNAINQLLLSLTLSRGDSLLNSLSDTFNLDTLSIKTGTGEAGAASDNDLAELVLGKYLSPNLYVSYGIGLFKPVNVLSLEYSLGQHWKLTSETSSESSGGDIVYTIER